MKATGPITQSLWLEIEDLIQELVECDFVNQLAHGTLSRTAFHHYLSQDALYLKDDNRALMKISERAEYIEVKSFFKTIAEDGIAIEEALQTEFFKHFGIKKATTKSPAVKQYTSHLLHHAHHSELPVAVAATLPCFWVYNTIGSTIYRKASKPNVYQKWIDTYQGADYEGFTARFIELTEILGLKVDKCTIENMKEAFRQSTQYELAFFEESIKKANK